ncbi:MULTISPECIES: hypothetical protein [Streptomyces]|uniref:hypothetical protein n=1 Tax=Streptomyces TaxID=1883 RepID=UPI000690EDB9|nr:MULTISPECIES: hypothetical protein [Streptomyces]
MSDPMTVLAMTGATTVVAAMATSVWEGTRDRVVDLFRRRDEDRGAVVRAQLDGDAELVLGEGEDTDGVRDDLVRPWGRRLAALLRDHPEAAEELRALIEDGAAPRNGGTWSQHVTAHAGGAAFGAQGPGSSVHVHHHRPVPGDTPT